MPIREVLFSPGNVADRRDCYDRLEPLRKLDINPVFRAEMPWEEGGIHWSSVIRSQVDGKFKLFYSTTYPQALEEGDRTVTIDNADLGSQQHVCCYAESDDGVHWQRPVLDLMLGDVFPDNNIIWNWPAYFNDSLSVIEDILDPDPARRYKMLIYHHDSDDPDLCGGMPHVSPDGLHWTRLPTVLPTQDAECLWQDRRSGRYYAFLKDRQGANRSRMLSTSDDFEAWSEPQWIITPDHGDSAGTNFYNQTAFVMAGRALGFLNVYDVATQTTWIELVESGDTVSWRRMPSRSPLLRPSAPGGLDAGGTYVGLNEPITVGDEAWYYYYAAPQRHSDADCAEGPAQKPTLCVAAFTRNRLVGQQTVGEGSFSTLPFRCPGGQLHLNFVSTEPVTVALQRPGYGGEIDGFTLAECEPVRGDLQDGAVRWKSGKTPADVEGAFVRLAVSGKNAVVYSASFVE